jgi:hypothetical protein
VNDVGNPFMRSLFVLSHWMPLLLVCVYGAGLAIQRWQRHPQVTAWFVIALACMLAASLGAAALSDRLFMTGGQPIDRALLAIASVATLVRTVGWAAALVAIFGWRPARRERSLELQFSIRGLLILTLVVAILCAWLRGRGTLLVFFRNTPLVICWIYGCWLALSLKKWHPQVSLRTLLAIGLSCAALLTFDEIWDRFGWTTISPSLISYYSAGSAALHAAAWWLLVEAALEWRSIPLRSAPRDAN